jgi:hypothetical protein
VSSRREGLKIELEFVAGLNRAFDRLKQADAQRMLQRRHLDG